MFGGGEWQCFGETNVCERALYNTSTYQTDKLLSMTSTKFVGMIEDETRVPISECVALKVKMYSYMTDESTVVAIKT